MKTHVLLVDDNASQSADRQHHLAGAGVEVMNESEERQAIDVVQPPCLNADIVVDPADFDIRGKRSIQRRCHDRVSFFRRWFDAWARRRRSELGRDETLQRGVAGLS
jgi:hypothetical protein